MDERSLKWEDRWRLEREGDRVMQILERHEEKTEELAQRKRTEDKWEKSGKAYNEIGESGIRNTGDHIAA